ncbi:MAG TPA: ABC transporter permease subunit [Chitinophagaceae bacterium]|jgi:ABC-2 type transport system permease protein|nr:ABC transporter permease subunit [Chitinophagaceae bacterium]
MWKLLQIELYKIFRRPRTYIAFGTIASLSVILQIGLKLDGKEYLDFMLNSLSKFQLSGNILNGYMVCYVTLQMLLIHVPLLITLIAADMISGEANMGTLRFMLTRPFSRGQIVLAKFFATCIYTFLLLVWLAAFALFANILVFGTGDLLILKSDYVVLINNNDVFWRYCGAFCFAFLSMTTVAAVGFFLSIFAENSIGPIVATMSIVVFLTVISTLNIPLYNVVKPFLFVTHMNAWKEFFDQKANANNVGIPGTLQNPGRIITSALVLIAHTAGLITLSVYVFRKKDILS